MKILLTILLLSAGRAGAAEFVVATDAELEAAVGRLRAGDTLMIQPGNYRGGWSVEGVEKLNVRAAVAEKPPVFVGGNQAWHFSRCPELTLSHLHLRGQKHNGINVDDGGQLDRPINGVRISHLKVEDIGPNGNFDGIKLSGLRGFTVSHCEIAGWGGQGIDLVGCHRGRIVECRLAGKDGFSATAGIQIKGGSSEVLVEACRFENAGLRPLNIGGSTGLAYFRPHGARHEARSITVRDCMIRGGECAAAFVGVDGAVFSKNRIEYPAKWIFRILQETRDPGFAPCGNVEISGNRIVFRRENVRTDINIGDATAPQTFVFRGNRWLAEDRPEASKPNLPVTEDAGVYGKN